MHKKILAICAALVAFAVAPAMASASPELQTSGGVKVATGTTIKATNTEPTVFTTTSGNITCTSATLEGPLVTNSGKAVEGNIETATFTGTGTSGRCTSTILILGVETQYQVTTKPPYCLVSTGGDVASIRGGKCSEAAKNVVFVLDAFSASGSSLGTCEYTRSSVSTSYATNTSPLVLSTAAEQTFTGPSGFNFCPSSGTLDAKFKVQTSTGGELKIV
jgi:hypothetical protein